MPPAMEILGVHLLLLWVVSGALSTSSASMLRADVSCKTSALLKKMVSFIVNTVSSNISLLPAINVMPRLKGIV